MKKMGECQRENHFYDAAEVSGVIVYVIDQDEPVCLKFSKSIKIKVLFDSFDNWNDIGDGKSRGFELVMQNEESAEVLMKNHEMFERNSAAVHEYDDENQAVTEEMTRDIQPNTSESEGASNGKAQGSENLEETEMRPPQKSKHQSIEDQHDLIKRSRRIMPARSKKFKPYASKGNTGADSKEKEDDSSDCNIQMESGSGSATRLKTSIEHAREKRFNKRDTKLQISLKNRLRASKNTVTQPKSLRTKKLDKTEKVQRHRLQAKDHESDGNLPVRVRPRKLLEQKTVKCEYCEVVFKNQQEYYNHRRAEESEHRCGICGKSEPYQAHLIVHMQKHRRIKVDITSDSPEKSQQNADSSSNKKKKNRKEKMKCNVCGLVVSSIDSLKIHTMLHTGEYSYRCCVCGENFSSLSSRQHHMDTHVSAHRFKCNPCGQRFASRAELAKHQLTHEIKCALCGEVFPNKTSRTCHFRVSHPDDILKCPLCSNMFATEEDLQKHLIYHKKGKKEQCPVCGVVVAKLKDHMLLHSQMAQEKMYVCDQCPMRYLRKSNLDRHMRTHTGEKPYACDRCPKRFRSNGMLRKHLLTHTQERPYQCEVCGKRCSLRSNLNIHMRVHNSDRHFPCTLCPQAFNHKNSLMGHMKNKHSQEMGLQDIHVQLDMPVNPPHQQNPQNLLADMNKLPGDPSEQQMHYGLQVGMAPNLGSDMLVKVEGQQDYNPMQLQMGYPPTVTNSMPSNILIDTDRNAMSKYDMQPQTGHTHGY